MTEKELTEWEHKDRIIKVLTCCEMGAWLHRRDGRVLSNVLQEIRQEIIDSAIEWYFGRLDGESEEVLLLDKALEIIDKHIKEYTV